jgi:hypothetical protein
MIYFLLGYVVSLTFVYKFRGVYIWPGTHDLYWAQSLNWKLWTFGSGLAGLLAGAALPKIRIRKVWPIFSILLLIALALFEHVIEWSFPADSVYAQTRSIVIFGFAILVGSATFWELKSSAEEFALSSS